MSDSADNSIPSNSSGTENLFSAHPLIWKITKWVITLAAYAFLAYKLITFDQYSDFGAEWRSVSPARFFWLALVVLLLPLNWLLEAVKWQKFVKVVEQISLKQSYNAVLAGITTGFFTPNRIGEMVGRIIYLRPENRKAGVSMSVLNGLTLNMIVALFGIPASIVFFNRGNSRFNPYDNNWIWLLLLFIVAVMGLYFYLPPYIRKKSGKRKMGKFSAFVGFLSQYTSADLAVILFISAVRFLLFSLQYYFMLLFFNIDLTLPDVVTAIPANYLFITFTPKIAFSEGAVRSSYAVIFFGAYSNQTAGLALVGITIWMINYAIPMALGSIVLNKKKKDTISGN